MYLFFFWLDYILITSRTLAYVINSDLNRTETPNTDQGAIRVSVGLEHSVCLFSQASIKAG